MTHDWTGRPVTLLGLSKSGIAAAHYLAKHGARCFLSETVPATPGNAAAREELKALGVEIEMGGHTARCFEHSDLVIVSPGIPPSSQVLKELALSGKTILSEVELAYRETDTPFVAITGTNGKTTTTTLISAILTDAGWVAPACGNIGTPIISLVDDSANAFVAELSSFQLTFSLTLQAKIAILLNFRPDHLDWHGSVDAYKEAKFALFTGVHTPGWSILNAEDPVCQELSQRINGPIVWFGHTAASVSQYPNAIWVDESGQITLRREGEPDLAILSVQDLKLLGAHNRENVLAAAAACTLLGIPTDTIRKTATAFTGVEHRLEPVDTVDGVVYYNDSKATNPDATLSALAAFSPRQVVLIAGGRDKKTDLSEFVDSVKTNASQVVLLGEAADRFALELSAAGYGSVTRASSLEDAVAKASRLANPQTPVLFSPACSSFDMYKNFEERGQAFKAAVRSLAVPSTR